MLSGSTRNMRVTRIGIILTAKTMSVDALVFFIKKPLDVGSSNGSGDGISTMDV